MEIKVSDEDYWQLLRLIDLTNNHNSCHTPTITEPIERIKEDNITIGQF
jgi:hypothetical protein